MNHAIHMAAVTQVGNKHSAGRAYYDKKIAEGKTPRKLRPAPGCGAGGAAHVGGHGADGDEQKVGAAARASSAPADRVSGRPPQPPPVWMGHPSSPTAMGVPSIHGLACFAERS